MPNKAMDASFNLRARHIDSHSRMGGICNSVTNEKYLNFSKNDFEGNLNGEGFQPSEDKENASNGNVNGTCANAGRIRIRQLQSPSSSSKLKASSFSSPSTLKCNSADSASTSSSTSQGRYESRTLVECESSFRRSPLHLAYSRNHHPYHECHNGAKHCSRQDDDVEDMEQDDDELCQIYNSTLESTSVSPSGSNPAHCHPQEQQSLSNAISSGRSNAKFLEEPKGEEAESFKNNAQNSEFFDVPLSFRANVECGSGFFLRPRPLRMAATTTYNYTDMDTRTHSAYRSSQEKQESCLSDMTSTDAFVTSTAAPLNFAHDAASSSSSSFSSPKSSIQSSIGSAFDLISR